MGRKPTAKYRTFLAALIVMGVAVLVFFISIQSDRQRGTAGSATSNRDEASNIQKNLVGTWRGEHGNIIDLRPDGTGRARFTENSDSSISYFKWSADASGFTMVLESRDKHRRWLADKLGIFKNAPNHYTIADVSPNSYRLVDLSSGDPVQFARTSDSLVETAP